MRLDVAGVAFAFTLLWGGLILLTGVANLVWPNYGLAFLHVVASIYPGYVVGAGFGSVLVATVYGLIDGAVAGAVYAWLYNALAGRRGRTHA